MSDEHQLTEELTKAGEGEGEAAQMAKDAVEFGNLDLDAILKDLESAAPEGSDVPAPEQ